jgi:hypothetical protein
MVDSDHWLVIRVDNNPDFESIPHMVNRDVLDIAWNRRPDQQWVEVGDIDLFWASPTCTEFSMAFNAPGPKARREGRPFEPCMELLEAVLELRRRWCPKYWAIENVIGAIPHFRPYLGEPSQIIGPFAIWSNLPLIDIQNFEHRKQGAGSVDPGASHPHRANVRGMIPRQLSDAIREAAECPTLGDFA